MTRETPTMPVHGGFNFPHPKSERKKHLHVMLKKAPCCCNWILIPRVSFTKHSHQPGAHSPEICFSQVMCKSGARIKKNSVGTTEKPQVRPDKGHIFIFSTCSIILTIYGIP